jgi:hypothetical protein
MKDDENDTIADTAGYDPFEFELANGNNVRIVFGKFWFDVIDTRRGKRLTQKYAVRIYSNEDVLSNHMALQHEFRADFDFGLTKVPEIWDWLEQLIATRTYLIYDSLDDFILEFAEHINQSLDAGEDAVEHLQHLPELTMPAAFDKVDDSIFTDQNDRPDPN